MSSFTSSDRSLQRLGMLPPIAAALFGVILLFNDWRIARPLWLDEQMILLNLKSRGITELAGELWLDQSAPLGWLAIQDVVLQITGGGELWLRAMPALFGAGAIIAAAWVATRWFSPVGGTVFVLLCAFGQWLSFYAVEMKPYSADVFWGVLLPALAVWAAEAKEPGTLASRLRVWGGVAAFSHWLSFGALFLAPACLSTLGIIILMRRERTAYVAFLGVCAVWLLSFGLHYMLTIGATHGDRGLQGYWREFFPPAAASVRETAEWLGNRLKPFAEKPGGTLLWQTFWVTAVIGWAVARPHALGVIAAGIVVTGFLLAGLRVLPLYERLSLWLVPSIYLGVALFADIVPRVIRRSRRHHWMSLSVAGLAAIFAVSLSGEVVATRLRGVDFTPAAPTNRDTDDRAAVRWIMEQLRPGDVIASSHYGLPALWWFGGGSVADEHAPARLPNGTPLYEIEHRPGAGDCGNRLIAKMLDPGARVFLYLGFPDTLPGVDEFLLKDLAAFAPITEIRHFAGISRVAVADPRAAAGLDPVWGEPYWPPREKDAPPVQGCAAYKVATRW